MLLKCLQILSGVVHSHIDKLDSRKQAENPDEFVKYEINSSCCTNYTSYREYEAEVEPIQNAFLSMNAHNKV